MDEAAEHGSAPPQSAASLRMEIEDAYLSVLTELRRIGEAEQRLGALGECGDDEDVQVRVARDAFERAVSGLLSRRSKAAQARNDDGAKHALDDFQPERFLLGQSEQREAWEARVQ